MAIYIYANIHTSFVSGKRAGNLSYYYNIYKPKYSLTMRATVSLQNLAVIQQENPHAFLLFNAMAYLLKSNPKLSAKEAITVAINREQLLEVFNKNKLKTWLIYLEDINAIRKVQPTNKLDQRYYINPNIVHVLYAHQREEFTKSCIDLFPPK